jgi:cell division transport system permease protein
MVFRKSDIYFAADDAQTFLPWLAGIMIFLAALLLCLGLSVSGWVHERNDRFSNRFTVHVPAQSQPGDAALAKLITLLEAEPGVASVRRLEKAELQAMLEPWLGESAHMDELPLPAIFEATLDGRNTPDYPALENRLRELSPQAEVDAQERWVAAFAAFTRAMQSLTLMLALLMVCGVAMVIAFMSRAALRLHQKTVQLLHSVGAEDRYIARQFQIQALRLLLPAALAGCVLAAGIYLGMGAYVASLGGAIMPTLAFTSGHVALLLALPPACLALGWLVSRRVVVRQLERTL